MNNFSEAYISKAIEYAKSQVQKLTEQVIVWNKELLYVQLENGRKQAKYTTTISEYEGFCDIAILSSDILFEMKPCLCLYVEKQRNYLSIRIYSRFKNGRSISDGNDRFSNVVYSIDLFDGFVPTGKEVFAPLDFNTFNSIDIIYREEDGERKPFREGFLAYEEINHFKENNQERYSYKYFPDINYSSVSEFKY